MSYEDRIIEGFTLPKPYLVTTLDEDPVIDALVAYLEETDVLKLEHIYTWVLI